MKLEGRNCNVCGEGVLITNNCLYVGLGMWDVVESKLKHQNVTKENGKSNLIFIA